MTMNEQVVTWWAAYSNSLLSVEPTFATVILHPRYMDRIMTAAPTMTALNEAAAILMAPDPKVAVHVTPWGDVTSLMRAVALVKKALASAS